MTHGGPAVKPLSSSRMSICKRQEGKKHNKKRKKRKILQSVCVPNSLNSAANLNVSPDLLFRFLRSSSWFRGGISLEGENKEH